MEKYYLIQGDKHVATMRSKPEYATHQGVLAKLMRGTTGRFCVICSSEDEAKRKAAAFQWWIDHKQDEPLDLDLIKTESGVLCIGNKPIMADPETARKAATSQYQKKYNCIFFG